MVMRRSLASIALFFLLLLIISYSAAVRIVEEGVEERLHLAAGIEEGGENAEAHGDLPVEVRSLPLHIVFTLATFTTGFTAYTLKRIGGRLRLV
jgi:hypothetical protein